jgi:hypothetical protein
VEIAMGEIFSPQLMELMKNLGKLKAATDLQLKLTREHLVLMDNSNSFAEAVAKYEALKLKVKELEKRQPWQVFVNPDKRPH